MRRVSVACANACFAVAQLTLLTRTRKFSFGKLNELDTEGVEPMSHTFSVHNVFREDEVTNGDDRENMLKNAPESKDGAYKVPKTFE